MLLDPERISWIGRKKTSPVGCATPLAKGIMGSQNSWVWRSQKPAIHQSNPSIRARVYEWNVRQKALMR